MKYIAGIFILRSVFYIISFAKYNIHNKNKLAGVGAIFLAFLVIALPLIVMFLNR